MNFSFHIALLASIVICFAFLLLQVKVHLRDDGPVRGPSDSSRGYDSHSSSPASSDHPRSQDSPGAGRPPPPPTALRPSSASRSSRGPAIVDSQPPAQQAPVSVPGGPEENKENPEDPSQQSFMGKVRAFEKMDHFARAQRMLELQEAQNARVSVLYWIWMCLYMYILNIVRVCVC